MRSLIPRRHSPWCGRTGVTLVELLVALALLGVVGGALLRAFDRQARFHRGILQLLQARQQLGASHDVLATEFRSLAALGDVERLTDTGIVYRAPLGSGVVCRVAGADLDLAPDVVAPGILLTRLRTAPQAGDTVWLHDEGATARASDDGWHAAEIAAAGRRTDGCLGTAYVDSVLDRGLASWRLSLASGTPVPAGVARGSVVRVTRRARFALYRSASGESNLGWADWNSALGAWNVIQPVAGPFLPASGGALHQSGVALSARDTTGASLSPPIAFPVPGAISVVTRARTARVVRMDGVSAGVRPDSLRSTTALRNTP